MSGLVFSLSEQGSSTGDPLSSDGIRVSENGPVANDTSPSKKGTCGANRHPLTPPDTPIKKPAEMRAKVEAGGIEIDCENMEKPRS